MNLYKEMSNDDASWHVAAETLQDAIEHYTKVFGKEPYSMIFVTNFVTVADYDLFTQVTLCRKENEDWFKAAERTVLEYLLRKKGKTQKEMSKLLGVTARVMNFKMQHYKLRIKDQQEVEDGTSV